MRSGDRWTNYGLLALAGLGGVAVFYGLSAVSDAIAGALARSLSQKEGE